MESKKRLPLYSADRWDDEAYPRLDGLQSAFKLAWSRLGLEFNKDGAMPVHGNQVFVWQYKSQREMVISLFEGKKLIESETLRSRVVQHDREGKRENKSIHRTDSGMFSWLEVPLTKTNDIKTGKYAVPTKLDRGPANQK